MVTELHKQPRWDRVPRTVFRRWHPPLAITPLHYYLPTSILQHPHVQPMIQCICVIYSVCMPAKMRHRMKHVKAEHVVARASPGDCSGGLVSLNSFICFIFYFKNLTCDLFMSLYKRIAGRAVRKIISSPTSFLHPFQLAHAKVSLRNSNAYIIFVNIGV